MLLRPVHSKELSLSTLSVSTFTPVGVYIKINYHNTATSGLTAQSQTTSVSLRKFFCTRQKLNSLRTVLCGNVSLPGANILLR